MGHPRNSVNTPASERDWDRHDIRAEVERQGLSLTRIAKNAGLYASACRYGLMGQSRPGAEAIAEALGIPFHELFANIPPYDAVIKREFRDNERCMEGKSSAEAGQVVEGR